MQLHKSRLFYRCPISSVGIRPLELPCPRISPGPENNTPSIKTPLKVTAHKYLAGFKPEKKRKLSLTRSPYPQKLLELSIQTFKRAYANEYIKMSI